MAKRSTEEIGINMTPMIDVVFQLIIFFVVTAVREQQSFDESIRLAFAPSGPAIEKKDPRTVVVDVDERGRISVARLYLSDRVLAAVLKQAVGRYGPSTPVQIRGDGKSKHESVRVSFVAVKQKAGPRGE
jgi:biopolymer transport protein ExbD